MCENILTILSVLDNISIEKFKDVYDILLKQEFNENEQERVKYSHYDILRELVVMGYCEVDFLKRKIFICPPSFALLPIKGLPKIALTGGRTLMFENRLKNLYEKNPDKIKVEFQDLSKSRNSLFPKTIFIEAKSKNILRQVVERLKLEGDLDNPASYNLVAFSPNLEEIKDQLTYNRTFEPNWKKNIFCRKELFFKQFECLDEVKLVNYTNSITNQQKTWIWNKNVAAEVDRSWGRYIILNYFRKRIILFDPAKQLLGIPVKVPLPTELAKSAIYTTGNLPRIKMLRRPIDSLDENIEITLYDGVDKSLALEISKKLGQEIIEANL